MVRVIVAQLDTGHNGMQEMIKPEKFFVIGFPCLLTEKQKWACMVCHRSCFNDMLPRAVNAY
jgi:hypothetical protein